MPVEAFDGFDTYADLTAAPFSTTIGLQAKWYAPGGTALLSLVPGRFGGQGLQFEGQGVGPSDWVSRYFTSARADFAAGFALRIDNVGNINPLVSGSAQFVFERNGEGQIGIFISPAGAIQIVRLLPDLLGHVPPNGARGAVVLASSVSGIVKSGTWHYIGIEGTIDNSSGGGAVYLDGVAVVTASGVDTQAWAGEAMVDGFSYVGPNSNGSTLNFIIDDWATFDTNVWEGEARVDVLRPVSDSSVDFTPSSGSDRYAMVDETLGDADTTYNASNAVGDVDLFGMSDLSGSPTILAIQLVAYAKKTDAATRLLRLLCDPGGGVDEGSDFALPLDYTRVERALLTNPDTGVAWTPAEVNALVAGYKLEA